MYTNNNQTPVVYSFFTDPKLSELSLGAKVLYALMLERQAVRCQGSISEAYIVYTVEQVKQDLNCTVQKAVRYLKELEKSNLISRVKRGRGQAALTYVTEYMQEAPVMEQTEETGSSRSDGEMTACRANDSKNTRTAESSTPTQQSVSSRLSGMESNAETVKSTEASLRQNYVQRPSKTETHCSQDFPKRKPLYINNNLSNESIYFTGSSKVIKKENLYTESINHTKSVHHTYSYEQACMLVSEQIGIESIKQSHPEEALNAEIIVGVMAEVYSSGPEVRIRCGHSSIAVSTVQKEYLKLTQRHIESILHRLHNYAEKVYDMAAYLKAVLFREAQSYTVLQEKKRSAYRKRFDQSIPALA